MLSLNVKIKSLMKVLYLENNVPRKCLIQGVSRHADKENSFSCTSATLVSLKLRKSKKSIKNLSRTGVW